ncbi:caffeoylshikimate esterase-like [Abrus precatorius]|uniref:Caffeoylshikimate esterase-like n=1 Tax=Abrus precatorius TaxID=3816 RepID=A0A8B8LR81_ABRPR|nr:caffeoylshikimate esterase-like [Abrus precatorius]
MASITKDDLETIYFSNMDEAPARRRAREAFKDIQLAIDHCLFRFPADEVNMKEGYEVNSRGLEIFSKSWLPKGSPLKALVCYCHGYADTCTFYFEGVARKLASSGYGVFALDYPGFGLSDGLHGYIPSFENLVNDVIEHFTKIKEQKEYQHLPSFLLGESMGGAIALNIHFKQPTAWDGAALIAPLCKFAEDMIPHWLVKQILIGVAKLLPKTKLVPQKEEVKENIFRDVNKRKLAPFNVLLYKDKPRLGTALELLKATQELEQRLEEVCLPLLIMHGEADIITDPSASKALYEKAKIDDKKLCLYKDAFHTLLEGEPDETIFHVLDDIISWLDEHSSRKNKY